MAKALLIKSSAGVKENTQGAWHEFEQASPYLQGIITGDLSDTLDAETVTSMISGLPGVWSRAYAFGYAFKYTRKDANIETSGLIKFYETLVREWQGLVALLTLFPDRLTVSEPIVLSESTPEKRYNISDALGRVLFEDTDLWCDPTELKNTKTETPFVQLIHYNGALVGATSPYSLLFAAVDYNNEAIFGDIPWFRNGKLDDPLLYGNLDSVRLQKLYLMVKNMEQRLPEYEQLLQTNRDEKEPLKLTALYMFLTEWKERIKQKGKLTTEEGTLDNKLNFVAPFKSLFNVTREIYNKSGLLSFEENGGEPVNLQNILLQDSYIYGFTEGLGGTDPTTAPVYYLSAIDPENPQSNMYFPLPFSVYGLQVFKNRIKELLAAVDDVTHELRAIFKPQSYTLLVELYLVVDGRKQTPISREYEIKLLTGAGRSVIMWPNFISKNWTAYYLYSEYPTNANDVKFVPFYRKFSDNGGYEGGEFIMKPDKGLLYFTDESEEARKALQLVKYPADTALAEDHAYEIFRSEKPIGGLEIRSLINGKDRICGYLVLKGPNDDSMGAAKIRDLSYETNFEDVVVGIDFGSNNSCVTYARSGRADVQPVNFNNRRIHLLGAEMAGNTNSRVALRNELLFYQNEPTDNGQIKSRVHEHNRKYLLGTEHEEIAGGIPVFKSNIKVHDMDSRTVKTNAGTMHHNMKWLTDTDGRAKKKAYLKTVWLHAVADLYADFKLPSSLRWSYPGSFSNYDVLQYEQMYREFSQIPVMGRNVTTDTEPKTEAEAACNYALTNVSLSRSNILLGIDVGGTTADILLLAMDRNERAFKLTKQSSVRMAAGMLSEIAVSSQLFRNALLKYHSSPLCKFTVHGIEGMNDKPTTAPFYLNAILDLLDDEDFDAFYGALAQYYPPIFGVSAYITGLLLYYSGQLTAVSLKEYGYTDIKMIDLLPFGKGGRIFDWLDVYPGKKAASEYYKQCFTAGFGNPNAPQPEKHNNIRKDNKSEVAIGLSAPQKVTVHSALREESDIVSESGYRFFPKGEQAKDLAANDVLNNLHFEEMDFGIELPERFEHFERFLDIFLEFAGPENTGIIADTALLQENKTQLYRELKAYITNDPEWQKANEQKQKGRAFGYKHPLIISEGLCFWDKFVVPNVYK